MMLIEEGDHGARSSKVALEIYLRVPDIPEQPCEDTSVSFMQVCVSRASTQDDCRQASGLVASPVTAGHPARRQLRCRCL